MEENKAMAFGAVQAVQDEKVLPLAEQVAGRINQLIIERNLQPDEKLPNEFELCEYLNVSRGTVREAIKLLVSRNVVEIRRGKGTYICAHTGMIEDPLGLVYMPDRVKLARELLEIRQHMEPWITAQAAEHATDEDIQRLRACCEAAEKKRMAGDDYMEEDKAFHNCIAECTHNRVIPKLMPVIQYSVDLFAGLYKDGDGPEGGIDFVRQKTNETHRHMLEAIERHDPEYARMAAYEHLIGNQKQVEAFERYMNKTKTDGNT